MKEPKLRTANKVVPPYKFNEFPHSFIKKFAENIVYMLATKPVMSIEGNDWEKVFAECINAEWKPSNIGLDDVQLDNCCWSAKTVKASAKIGKQKTVRLISGRNSPTYSYGVDRITESDPNEIGRMVLDIWNARVSSIRKYFKFARTVVLVKSDDYSEYLLFELETIRYDADLYQFSWNPRGNLVGFEKGTNRHKFTWQPSGSQFTIIEDIPVNRLHLKIQKPEKLDRTCILEALDFNDTWITKLD